MKKIIDGLEQMLISLEEFESEDLEYYKEIVREATKWEEIPDEDLWEDGELDTQAVIFKMYSKVCRLGEWKLIREVK